MKEVLETLANRVLEQATATNRLANAVERRENSDNLLRQELSKLNHTHDEHRHEMRHEISNINVRLGILSKDVDDTAKFQVQAALVKGSKEENGGGIVGLVKALGKLPPKTLVLMLIFLGLLIIGGWAKALL